MATKKTSAKKAPSDGKVTVYDLLSGAKMRVRKPVAEAMFRNPDRFSKTATTADKKEKQP